MSESFERKLAAGSAAGWKVLLIFAAVLVLQYVLYLAIAGANGAFVASLFGNGVDWPQIRTLWIWMMMVLKILFLSLLLLNLWMMFWAKELKKIL